MTRLQLTVLSIGGVTLFALMLGSTLALVAAALRSRRLRRVWQRWVRPTSRV